MRSNKQINYYYKACDLDSIDTLERKQFEYFNDYGYNTDSSKRRIIDYDSQAKRLKYQKNNDFFKPKT